MKNVKPNKLAVEKSPYLLQHAYNPVDWMPWGDEAFEKAKTENKPIFLSIGYSTCHWCHVMERESFEDSEVAEILNKDFVSIKVDREERPDIDHLYMTVCQAMTGQGGWPLTIVMTPSQKPFFAGTYFPKVRKYNRYGLMDILPQIIEKWENENEKILLSAESITERTHRNSASNQVGPVPETLIQEAIERYKSNYREPFGGFSDAPKFPTSHNLSFLLRYAQINQDESILTMVENTLQAMFRGGIYDHVGQGFARYSTDERWLVPHFEKMLYDNALLAMTYIEAYQVTKNELYLDIANAVFSYVLRDMRDIEGGFYSAEDADSEGIEGKFYVWKREEVLVVLGHAAGETWSEVFDITEHGNFENHNIPNLIQTDLNQYKQINPEWTRKLFEHRENRIKPSKDDKILTSWNGLMIMAFAKGYATTNNENYRAAAETALSFIWNKMRREDGRLYARHRDGESAILGFLDDYAFLLWATIELYDATGNDEYLTKSINLADDMIRLFLDEERAGFYFSGVDGERLIARTTEIYDGAIPSGNFVAAYNLIRLARLTENNRYEELASKNLMRFGSAVAKYPLGYSLYLTAHQLLHSPSVDIVLVGEGPLTRVAYENRPLDAFVIRSTSKIANVSDKAMLNHQQTVYVCENASCKAPVTDVEELRCLLTHNRIKTI